MSLFRKVRWLIKKAVIPAAGLGTRMLPLTKFQPKEMLPIGSKPCIQYIVEELAVCGVEEILIITGPKKRVIEDHFDKENEINQILHRSEQPELFQTLAYEDMNVHFFYTRQSSPRGLGDAVRLAKSFVNNEPFIVALGDSIIFSPGNSPLLARMIDLHHGNPSAMIIGTRVVPREDVFKYGIIKPAGETTGNVIEIADVVEKPSSQTAPSNIAFAARYILPPDIFSALDRTSPGRGGEVQLTDAIRLLLKEGVKGYGVPLAKGEKRYDIGNMGSYFEAFVDFALRDEKYGYMLKQYIVRTLNL